MRARRLAALAVAVVAGAILAPQASAGGQSTVSILPVGNGTGSVVALGPQFGINCFSLGNGLTPSPPAIGSVCNASYPTGTQLTILALPAGNSSFAGWNAFNCPAPNAIRTATTCSFAVPPNSINLTASFSTAVTLTVGTTGTGSGTVVGPGINCGTNCTATFQPGGFVTLTAVPAAGSTFVRWVGACGGSGSNPACVLPMSTSHGVGAIFNLLPTVALNVSTTGTGSGTVTSSPPGLTCPPTCSAAVIQGTVVTLAANAEAGSQFSGWSGSCTGRGACVIPGTSDASVTATFDRASVDATVEGTSIRRNGPRRARRVLRVNVAADEQVRVNLRIVRGGDVLAGRTVVRFRPGERNIRFPIRNGIARGTAQLRVTFTDQFGNTKTQTRRIRIPRL